MSAPQSQDVSKPSVPVTAVDVPEATVLKEPPIKGAITTANAFGWKRFSAATWGWIFTVFATVLGGFLRMWDLGRFKFLVFDETYYVKDSYALWHAGFETSWNKDVDKSFVLDPAAVFNPEKAGFAVHPQTGKWLIGSGMELFGPTSPTGWRIGAALAGTLCILILCRLAWRLFASPIVTGSAGIFLATDGIAITMSRTALLDVFLALFTLLAFYALVRDGQACEPELRKRLALWERNQSLPWWKDLGPHCGHRPWLLAAGIFAGLAMSVKWSGIYVLATIGIFVVLREMAVRHHAGMRSWLIAACLKDGIYAFFILVPPAILTYLVSWWSWLSTPGSWGRGSGGFFTVLSNLITYHQQVLTFHNGVTSSHPYASSPLTWLVQYRPVSFVFEEGTGACAGNKQCVQAVLCLGNPALWWLGIVALVALIIWFASSRDWRIGVILAGYGATYVPWFFSLGRTVFLFYMVVLSPFVSLALGTVIGVLAGEVVPKGMNKHLPLGSWSRWVAATIFAVVLLFGAYFMPLWLGSPIARGSWYSRIWLPSWM